MQVYERRFNIWLDNLRFAHEYNARHTSHWVRRHRRWRSACTQSRAPNLGAADPGLRGWFLFATSKWPATQPLG